MQAAKEEGERQARAAIEEARAKAKANVEAKAKAAAGATGATGEAKGDNNMLFVGLAVVAVIGFMTMGGGGDHGTRAAPVKAKGGKKTA